LSLALALLATLAPLATLALTLATLAATFESLGLVGDACAIIFRSMTSRFTFCCCNTPMHNLSNMLIVFM
jgi:hypothetical protein